MTERNNGKPTSRSLVIVDYQELTNATNKNEELQEKLENAFGVDGIGLIGIRNVPGFVETKVELLSLAHSLANLPEQELKELESPETLYNTGWSHGKEKLKHGTPDWNKASFYFNPLSDLPGTQEERRRYPLSYPSNKWPNADSLPSFKTAAQRLGSLMKDVAVDLSRHIDNYAQSRNDSYEPETLFESLVRTEKVKGRLLYYYPLMGEDQKEEPSSNQSEDSWIGWHNDSGFLTCLSGGLFMEPDGTILPSSPCDSAGLYVAGRNDQVFQVKLPGDCMGIQIGECTQILSGGAVIATPHCVKGAPNVARTSFACFIDTSPTYPLRAPSRKGSSSSENPAFSSSRVPPLCKRWYDGMLFGDFLEKTFKMYYDFDPSSTFEEESDEAK
jgi:isopenicillin N synthase-like dioxygenase